MNISKVNVKLKDKDLFSILKDFIKVDGLEINNVDIKDGITISGTYTKSFNVDYELKIDIIECAENKVIAKISKFKVFNLGIFRMMRSFILKQLLKEFSKIGIDNYKDKVIINVKKLLKDIPYIDLDIDDLFIKNTEIWVDLKDIKVSIKGTLKKEYNEEESEEDKQNEHNNIFESMNIESTVDDKYSRGRKVIENRLSDKTKKYKDYIFLIPDIISLTYRLLKDNRVPIKTKIIISMSIGYIAIPVDFIPSNIPFIGTIDDIGVALFTLNKVLNDVPLDVILENWEGKNELILVIQSGLEYLVNFTHAKNVEKLYQAVEELSAL